jgi:rhamnogalacturonyl hydrolase YesR
MNFSVDEQNADGSFYYWSLREAQIPHMTETTLKTIDHYHTGFVLRSLHSIYHVTGEKWVFQSLEKGYRFYRDHLFEDRRIPKLKPDFIYPVDIHSCAEAILCLSTLSDLFPEAIEYATNVFRWTIANMQDKDGHFYYRKTEGKTNKIPYIRWGQAWMMRALTKLLETTGDGSSERPPHEE